MSWSLGSGTFGLAGSGREVFLILWWFMKVYRV